MICSLGHKFEVFTFTHYEDVKGNANCRNFGSFGMLVTQGHRQHNHSIECIQFPVQLQ